MKIDVRFLPALGDSGVGEAGAGHRAAAILPSPAGVVAGWTVSVLGATWFHSSFLYRVFACPTGLEA